MGDYATATSFGKTAPRIATSEFGADAPETATVLNYLALTYDALARYAEEPLYRQAIAIDEKALSKAHPDVAADYNNLALFLP